MFSVYGVTGREFVGSMEQLRHIERINAASRVRRLDANEIELPTTALAEPPPPATPPAAAANPPAGPVRAAIAAYAQALLPETQRQPLMRVDQIMVQPAVTIAQDSSVLDAWKLLAYHGFGQAPVVNASGMLVGLLLRADLFRVERLASPDLDPKEWKSLMEQPVSELMWTPVPSVAGDTDIRRVAGVLIDTGLPGLPVADELGAVKGFVARADILRAVAHDPPLDLWG